MSQSGDFDSLLRANQGDGAQLQERFGLSGDPFSDDPEFFFTGGQRQHALDSLRHLTAFGDMVLVVTGEPGSGKTSLVRQLAHTESRQLDVRELPASVLDAVERLPSVLSRLSGEPLTEQNPSEAAASFFAASARQDRRWVLVVEDADEVPAAVLAVLAGAAAATDEPRACALLLTGTAALSSRLQDSLEDGSSLHTIELAPISKDDIRHYIQSRFDRVGGDASHLLTPGRLEQLASQSGGNLQRLNAVAPQILLGSNQSEAPPAAAASPSPRDSSQASPKSAHVPRRARPTMNWRFWSGIALGLLGLSFIMASLFHGSSEDDTEYTEDVEFDEFDEVERARAALDDQTTDEPAATASEPPRFDPFPVEPPAPTPVETVAEVVVEPEPGAAEEGEVEEEPATAEPPADDFEPARPEHYRDSAWVEGREEGHYTVQLLGSFNESTAIQLIERHEEAELYYVRSEHQGEPWFVVLYGDYDGRDSARNAINTLPEALRAVEPWVRTFDGL